MSVTVAQLRASLTGDSRDFDRMMVGAQKKWRAFQGSLAGQTNVSLSGDSRDLDQELSSSTRSILGWNKKASKYSGIDFTGDMSRLEYAQNFGLKTMKGWKQAADNFGKATFSGDNTRLKKDVATATKMVKSLDGQKATVQARAETGQFMSAMSKVKAMTASADDTVHIDVDVDQDRLAAASAGFSQLTQNIRNFKLVASTTAGIPAFIAAIGGVVPVATATTGALLQLAGAMGQGLAGAAVAGAGAMGILAGSMAAVLTPVGMLMSKLKEASDATDAVAGAQKTATSAAQAYSDALLAVEEAERGVAEAAEQGAEQIKAAEVALASSRDELESATQAVIDAEAELQDLRDGDEARSLGQAEDDLTRSRWAQDAALKALNEAEAKYGKNSREAQEAQLDLNDATRDYGEQLEATKEIREGGTEALQNAKKAVEETRAAEGKAASEVKTKEAELTQAREEAGEAVAAAQRQVTSAMRAAEQALAAQAAATEAVSAATVTLTGDQQALLTRWEQFSARGWDLMTPAIDSTARLGVEILNLADLAMPRFAVASNAAIGGVTSAFGDLRAEMMQPVQQTAFETFMVSIEQTTDDIASAAGLTGLALFNMFSRSIPYGQDLLEVLSGGARRFNDWTQSAAGLEDIDRTFANLVAQGGRLWQAVKNLSGAFAGLFNALGQGGAFTKASIGFVQWTAAVKAAANQTERISGFMKAAQPTLESLGGLVTEVYRQFFILANSLVRVGQSEGNIGTLATVIDSLTESLAPLRRLLQSTFIGLGPVLADLLPDIAKLAEVFLGTTGPLQWFLGGVNKILETFNAWPRPVKSVIASLVAMNTIMSVLGGPTLFALVGGLAKLGVGLAVMRRMNISPVTALTGALKNLGRALFFTPWGRAALILVAAGTALYQNWDKIKKSAGPLTKAFGGLWDALKELGAAFAAAFNVSIPSFGEAFAGLPPIIGPVLGALTRVVEAMTAFAESDVVVEWAGKIGAAFTTAATAVGDFAKDMYTAGMDATAGFREGLRAGAIEVFNAVAEFARNALQSFKDVLGIASPSTETEEAGGDFVDGFINGIVLGENGVMGAVGALANAATGGLAGGLLGSAGSIGEALKRLFGDTVKKQGEVAVKEAQNAGSRVGSSFSSYAKAQETMARGAGQVLGGGLFAGMQVAISTGKLDMIAAGEMVIRSFVEEVDRGGAAEIVPAGRRMVLRFAGVWDAGIGPARLAAEKTSDGYFKALETGMKVGGVGIDQYMAEVINGFLVDIEQGGFGDAFIDLFSRSFIALKEWLGIKSPSTRAAGVTADVISGFVGGLSTGKGKLTSSLRGLAGTAWATLKSSFNPTKWASTGTGIVKALAKGIFTARGLLIAGLVALAVAAAVAFKDEIKNGIGGALEVLKNPVTTKTTTTVQTAGEIASGNNTLDEDMAAAVEPGPINKALAVISQKVQAFIAKAKQMGAQFIAGLITGFSGGAGTIGDTMDTIAKVTETPLLGISKVAGQVFGGLASIVSSAFSIVKGVISEAAGPIGDAFAIIGKHLGIFAAIVGPQIVIGLRDMMAGFKAMLPIINPIANLIGGALIGAFEAILPIVGIALVAAFRGLGLALRLIGPGIGWVGEKLTPFGKVFQWVGRIIGWFAGGPILGALSKGLKVLGAVFKGVGQGISGVKKIVPVLDETGRVINQGLLKAVDPVENAFRTLGQVIGAVLGPLRGVGAAIFKFAGSAITGFGKFVSGLVAVNATVMKFFQIFFSKIGQVASAIGGAFRGTSSWSAAFKLAWNVIKQGIEEFVTWFKKYFNIGQTVDDTGKYVVKGWQWMIGQVLKFTGSFVKTLIQHYKNIWNTIKGPIAAFFRWFAKTASGKAIITAFKTMWKALTTDVTRGWKAVSGVVTRGWKAITSIFKGSGRTVSIAWQQMWLTIKMAATRAWMSVKTMIGGAWKTIKGLFTGNQKMIEQGQRQFWAGLKMLTTTFKNAFQYLMKIMWTAVSKIFNTAVARLKTMLGTAWDNIKTTASEKWNAIRTSITNVFTATVDAVVSKAKAFWTSLKSIFETIRDAVGPIFTAIGDKMKSAFSTAIDAIKGLLGGLLSMIAAVLTAFGQDDLASKVKNALGGSGGSSNAKKGLGPGSPAAGAKGGVYHGTGRTEGLVRMASGGILGQKAVGGLADGKTPRAVYGEVGKREYYIVPERKDNVPYLAGAAQEMGYNLAPTQMADGGKQNKNKGARKAFGYASGHDMEASGGGTPGGAAHHNVTDQTRSMAESIAKATGTYWNSYPGHGQLGGATEDETVDFWGGPAVGTPIGAGAGFATAEKVLSQFQSNLLYIIRQGEMWRDGGWKPWPEDPHNDHTHVSWAMEGGMAGGSSPTSTGPSIADQIWEGEGAGPPKTIAGTIVRSFLSQLPGAGLIGAAMNAFPGLNHIIPIKGKDQGSMGDLGGGIMAQALEGFVGEGAKGWAKDKIYKEFGAAPSGGGTFSGGGTIDEWISQGFALGAAFPDSTANHAAMKSRVMQESGGDPNAVNNWDSNAQAGTPSKGLVQIIEPTWNANTTDSIGQFDANWMDPVKSVGVSSRYMKSQYGHVVGASGTGYAKGGIVPGGGGGSSQTMPSSVRRAFITVADTLADYAGARPRSGPGVAVGDEGGVGSGKEIVAITNEAGPEGVMPLRKWTRGGQQAFDAGKGIYGREHRGGARRMAAGGVTGMVDEGKSAWGNLSNAMTKPVVFGPLPAGKLAITGPERTTLNSIAWPNMTPNAQQAVVNHELGHQAGFMGHLGTGNVMQPAFRSQLSTNPTNPTAADVSAVAQASGLNPSEPGNEDVLEPTGGKTAPMTGGTSGSGNTGITQTQTSSGGNSSQVQTSGGGSGSVDVNKLLGQILGRRGGGGGIPGMSALGDRHAKSRDDGQANDIKGMKKILDRIHRELPGDIGKAVLESNLKNLSGGTRHRRAMGSAMDRIGELRNAGGQRLNG